MARSSSDHPASKASAAVASASSPGEAAGCRVAENDPCHTRMEGCRMYERAQAPSLRAEVLSRDGASGTWLPYDGETVGASMRTPPKLPPSTASTTSALKMGRQGGRALPRSRGGGPGIVRTRCDRCERPAASSGQRRAARNGVFHCIADGARTPGVRRHWSRSPGCVVGPGAASVRRRRQQRCTRILKRRAGVLRRLSLSRRGPG